MYHLLNTMFKKLFQLKKRTTYDEIYDNSSSVLQCPTIYWGARWTNDKDTWSHLGKQSLSLKTTW